METYVIKLLNNLELLKRCREDCIARDKYNFVDRGLYFVIS